MSSTISQRDFHLIGLHLMRCFKTSAPALTENTKIYSVRATKLRLWRSGFLAFFSSTRPYQSVCTLVWIYDDYKTLNQALPCPPALVAATLGGGRLQCSSSVGPLWCQWQQILSLWTHMQNTVYIWTESVKYCGLWGGNNGGPQTPLSQCIHKISQCRRILEN